MAGHSKWANIKHKKARNDAARGKEWSKCSRAIMVAAKDGGSDPDKNLALRYAVEEAKACNMPKDTIERAAKKGAGELGGQTYESIRYEGYGAAGVAVIVDALTDNRNRTAPEMRTIFGKYSGNLGATGCVGYLFDTRGVISIEEGNAPGEDELMELALEAGAEDVELEDGMWTLTCDPTQFLDLKAAIDAKEIKCASAMITMLPQNTVEVEGNDAGKIMRLMEALDDHDDVQKVYSNFDISEEELAKLDA